MTTGRWSNWRCGRAAMATAVVVALAMATACSAINRNEDNSDLNGSYCASRRTRPCCDNRQDECTAPILDTKCYCDEFCDRGENNDCCPDFWTVCRHEPPTTTTKSEINYGSECLKRACRRAHDLPQRFSPSGVKRFTTFPEKYKNISG